MRTTPNMRFQIINHALIDGTRISVTFKFLGLTGGDTVIFDVPMIADVALQVYPVGSVHTIVPEA